MEEYQDCLQRARRLAVACEVTLAGGDSAMSVVTMDDLLIYSRWFICMLHSVKNIHAFIRVSVCLGFSEGLKESMKVSVLIDCVGVFIGLSLRSV